MDKGEARLKGSLVPDRTAVQFHLQVQDSSPCSWKRRKEELAFTSAWEPSVSYSAATRGGSIVGSPRCMI